MKDSVEKDQKQFFQALPVDSFQFDYTFTRTNLKQNNTEFDKKYKEIKSILRLERSKSLSLFVM